VKRALWIVGTVLAVGVLGVAGWALVTIGPNNLWGMLRYDQREEGTLKVGDPAPDVVVAALDGKTDVHLAERMGARPLLIVFGSYT
jgi:hypothetical protein